MSLKKHQRWWTLKAEACDQKWLRNANFCDRWNNCLPSERATFKFEGLFYCPHYSTAYNLHLPFITAHRCEWMPYPKHYNQTGEGKGNPCTIKPLNLQHKRVIKSPAITTLAPTCINGGSASELNELPHQAYTSWLGFLCFGSKHGKKNKRNCTIEQPTFIF